MQGDISSLKTDMSRLKTEVFNINLRLENVIARNIRVYSSTNTVIIQRMPPKKRISEPEAEVGVFMIHHVPNKLD